MNYVLPRPLSTLRFAFIAFVSMCFLYSAGYASSFSWNAASGSWGTSGNWTPAGVPGASDTADFSALTLSAAVVIDATNGSGGGVSVGVINLGDVGSSRAYTIQNGTGGSLTMDNGSLNSQINEQVKTGGDTISASILVAGNGKLDITNLSGKTFTIGGTITSTAGSGNTNTVTVKNSGAGSTVINGLSDGAVAGSLRVILDAGASSITMNTANNLTFSGNVEIKSGRVVLGSGSGLGVNATSAGTAVTLDSGASIELNAKGIQRNLVLSGTGYNGKGALLNNTTGTATLSSNNSVTLAADTGFGPKSGAAITINSAISGAGALLLLDQGTLTLTRANSYAGGTVVRAGTLVLSGGGSAGSGDIRVEGGSLSLQALNAVADDADLTFAATSLISLNFSGTETIGALSLTDGGYIAEGTYVASQLNTYFNVSVFSGSGILNVTAVPEPGALVLVCLGLAALGGSRIRRRAPSAAR